MMEGATRIGFEHPLPGWAWLLIIVAIGAIVVLVYARQRAPIFWRVALGVLRGIIALALVVLLAGPRLERVDQEKQRDMVVLLIDRSASLTIADVASADPMAPHGRMTRDEQVRTLLAAGGLGRSDGPSWVERLASSRDLVLLGFDGSVHAIGSAAALGPAEGKRTDLSNALSEALRRAAGRALSAIVVVSDGRSDTTIPARLRRELIERGAVVVAVPLGSGAMPRDLEVVDVDAPRRAYVRDPVPMRVSLRSRGPAPNDAVTIQLVHEDGEGAEIVDEATIQPEAWTEGVAQAIVVAQSDDPGDRRFRVIVSGGAGADDLVLENNERSISMSFADEPLRVLYLEGYPRWEYRYIKNMLVREETIDSSVMLVSADLDFAQEGNVPLARLPQTDEECAQFDLFILGDVPGSFLSPTQVEAIRRSVGERGAGLLWLGGERSTPGTWKGTALEDLLPFRQTDVHAASGSWSVMPARAAERLGVLRMDESGGWPDALRPPAQRWARLAWAQDISRTNLKSVVEVIAEAVPLDGGDPMPLVTLMRYGAGEVIYVGTDETWRWRHGIGETLQERFWIQLIRQLARTSLAARGAGATIEVEPVPARVAHDCVVRVQLRDSTRDPAEFEPMTVGAIDPQGNRATIALVRQGASGLFSSSFQPTKPGVWRIVLEDPRLGDRVDVQLRVEQDSDELANPAADHETLHALAAASNGLVVEPREAATIPERLPDRTLVSERVHAEPLWHQWWVLTALTLLLAMEWIGRRVVRLA